MHNVEIQTLDKRLHDREKFDCDELHLNRFLACQSSLDASRCLSKTYVAIHPQNPEIILGFSTLAFCNVEFPIDETPFRRYPHPLPGVKLARLAVDKYVKGQGIGKHLLADAILKTANTKRNETPASVIGLFVDAKDKSASFYRKYGFVPIETQTAGTFWLPMTQCIEFSKIIMP